MTDREKIIAEIERLKDFFKTEREKTTTTDKGMVDKLSFSSKIVVLEELLVFINSLPAEQPSERLGDEIDHFRCSDIFALAKRAGEEITATAQHFADWQKEQMMKYAIDAVIVNDEISGCVVDCEQGCLVLEPHRYPIGQKLKILILEDEQ